MANKVIAEMGLPKSIGNIFAARNIITAKDALSLTEFELMELLDVSLAEVMCAVTLISEIASPPYQTVQSLLEQRMQNEYLAGHLPTRLKGLDAALFGGIPFGALTELVGPAGIGKTQFCLKLSLLGTLPSCYGGLDGHVIYIDVESKFSSKRLIEIGLNSFPEIFCLEGMAKEMAGRITVLRPGSLAEFTERSLAEFSRIPVVMTNQVRSRSSSEVSEYSFQAESRASAIEDSANFDSHLVAALGIHWAHAVTIRLVLESRSGQRFIKVAKSPMSPPLAFPFEVTSSGISLLNDDGVEMAGPQINAIDHQVLKRRARHGHRRARPDGGMRPVGWVVSLGTRCAFITVLFEKLAAGDLISFARSEGIDVQLNKWKDTLSQIQAVLADAGQKHLRDRSVELWLNKLQHLAYDIDDLLDDLATEAMQRQVKQESYASTSASTSKVFKIIPTCCTNFTPNTIAYGRQMSSKLDEIATKLCLLVEEKNSLGLNIYAEKLNRATRRSKETSLVEVSKIVGREGDREALLGKLLENESCSENQYYLQAISVDEKKFEDLNKLQESLSEKLAKRRFLLVLDDVWNEDYTEWELLQRPFVVGAPGSKIIVTTRKTTVASVMDSDQAYPMKLLSEEEALSLLAQHALGKQNFDSHPTLKLHGEGIVKKCDGLPLALITVGRVLRTKANDEEWEELLNSDVWNLQYKDRILPALKLSYYDLPPYLKQMFAYCGLFPKDYVFGKDELVLLWMAEGFLYLSNGSKSMEKLGRECFEELRSRSFFQHLGNDNSSLYTMHDLINDLATSVGGEFFLTLDNEMNLYDKNEAFEKLHHLSFVSHKYGVYRKFKALQRAKRLRTFLSVPVTKSSFHLSRNVLYDLVPQLQLLRVLSLANYSIEKVPQSIGSLKHLRYLKFSETFIECLPEQIGDLHNLQSLIVSHCLMLSSLPDSVVKLKNLRHLYMVNTPKLNKLPLGIGGLTGLRTLSKFIVREANGFKISDFKGLLHIQGKLLIQGLHTVMNAIHAKDVNLLQKKGLDELEMEWSDVFDDSRNEISEYEVLEGLRPHEKLRSLKIMNYMGMKFPSWVGDPSFVYLTHLTLRGCGNCTRLPTLGHLRSLKSLFVEGMSGLKRLGLEFLGTSSYSHGIAFPSLEKLEFEDMQDWEVWSSNDGDEDGTVGSYPCLRQISIINCPKLNVVEIELIPSLVILDIQGCSVAVLRNMVGVSQSIRTLIMMNIKGLTHLHGDVLENLGALERLFLKECDELIYLWEANLKACEILKNLRVIRIEFCNKLVSLVDKDAKLGISLKFVENVTICECPKVVGYNCPNSMEKLVIYKCDSFTSLTFPTEHDLECTMKIFYIISSHTLDTSWLLNNYLSSLGSLAIVKMPNLRSLPEGCLLHLTKLEFDGCENIESIPEKGFGFFPLLCLTNIYINKCKNLKSFPHQYLQSLASLEQLTVSDCPSMDCSFPCGLWPPNIRLLEIGGLKKPMSEWGMQNFPTSLVVLNLYGQNSGVVSFATAEDVKRNGNNTTTISSSLFLPPSLTSIALDGFMELESLSKCLQHLTCLEMLSIKSCPKLKDLPETLLPLLSYLRVVCCPEVEKRPAIYKSPMSPPLAFPFEVTSSGILLLNDDGVEMAGPQINSIDHQGHSDIICHRDER
ncbi:hypothetical protein OSB04_023526 [Centaurea solstitialis]|uniref:RecA family profile 1 domain-containing protein n=1 Tax=Centaurea solstitialis TaxID=347529 RepID=A0AA38SL05_9ASTR|nr:hypothetical protein OSB04_023526 [Centaurea solstitialis]